MSTILYARVSTADQTVAIQIKQAKDAGFSIDQVIADEGISGVSTKLAERPQGKRLFDILRAGDILLVRWIDRLGRNFDDVHQAIQAFMEKGVIIKTVINAMVFDGATTDPVQKAVRNSLISFMAAIGEAQYEATKQAQMAGIAHAKLRHDAYRGRKPTFSSDQLIAAQEMLAAGHGVSHIATTLGISRQAVYRIRSQPEACAAALERWNPR